LNYPFKIFNGMNNLQDILYKAGITEKIGSTNLQINDICFDSRKISPKCLFVAVRGTNADGHQYIQQAVEKGAAAIVCEAFPEKIIENITYVKVADSSYSLGFIASNFFDNPSQKLTLIGVTGTNGKTTIATTLHQLFIQLGYNSGLLSTIKNKINNEEIPATHTTPDAIQLNQLLKKMVDKKCTHCFMEVSSHAAQQGRIAGLDFDGGIFTNLTLDHLDYHKTFDEYLKAKKKFFDSLSSKAFALSNIDDKNGKVMLQNTKAKKYAYALKTVADYKAKIIENTFSGLQVDIDGNDVWFKMIGEFNAYNLLAVYATAVLLEEEKFKVLSILSGLEPVEGRFDFIKSDNNITAIVDYAHTPDALKNVLETISTIRTGNETLISVVGCGGDRDRTKRPIMAKIACNMSNKVILTSDNPRSEDPEEIIKEMKSGIDPLNMKKVLAIVNREEAIKTACSLAQQGDIILVAGKGHEKYQEIKGVKHPFDDKKIVKEIFNHHKK